MSTSEHAHPKSILKKANTIPTRISPDPSQPSPYPSPHPTPTPAPPIPRTLASFHVHRRLNLDQHGVASYLAQDKHTHKPVVLVVTPKIEPTTGEREERERRRRQYAYDWNGVRNEVEVMKVLSGSGDDDGAGAASFVVRLYCSWHDTRNFYMVKEWNPTSLAVEITHRHRLDEDTVRFLAAEMLTAIESLHAKGITHRDLRPGNIQISEDGHVRVTGFESAVIAHADDVSSSSHSRSRSLSSAGSSSSSSPIAKLLKARNGKGSYDDDDNDDDKDLDLDDPATIYTFDVHDSASSGRFEFPVKPVEKGAGAGGGSGSGSGGRRGSHAHGGPDSAYYQTPEQHRGEECCGMEVDVWSVGVVVFRMLTGRMPFGDTYTHPSDIAHCVVYEPLVFRKCQQEEPLSNMAKALLAGMLEKERGKRLGLDEVKKHGFFDGIDWAKMKVGSVPSRFVPPVQNYSGSEDDVVIIRKGIEYDAYTNALPGFNYVSPALEEPMRVVARRDFRTMTTMEVPMPMMQEREREKKRTGGEHGNGVRKWFRKVFMWKPTAGAMKETTAATAIGLAFKPVDLSVGSSMSSEMSRSATRTRMNQGEGETETEEMGDPTTTVMQRMIYEEEMIRRRMMVMTMTTPPPPSSRLGDAGVDDPNTDRASARAGSAINQGPVLNLNTGHNMDRSRKGLRPLVLPTLVDRTQDKGTDKGRSLGSLGLDTARSESDGGSVNTAISLATSSNGSSCSGSSTPATTPPTSPVGLGIQGFEKELVTALYALQPRQGRRSSPPSKTPGGGSSSRLLLGRSGTSNTRAIAAAAAVGAKGRFSSVVDLVRPYLAPAPSLERVKAILEEDMRAAEAVEAAATATATATAAAAAAMRDLSDKDKGMKKAMRRAVTKSMIRLVPRISIQDFDADSQRVALSAIGSEGDEEGGERC